MWLQNGTPLKNFTHKLHFPFQSKIHIKPCSQVPVRFWFYRHVVLSKWKVPHHVRRLVMCLNTSRTVSPCCLVFPRDTKNNFVLAWEIKILYWEGQRDKNKPCSICNASVSTLFAHCAAAFQVHIFWSLQHVTGDAAPGGQSQPNRNQSALCVPLPTAHISERHKCHLSYLADILKWMTTIWLKGSVKWKSPF